MTPVPDLRGFKRFLEIWFSGSQRARRMIGGKWEYWVSRVGFGTGWYPVLRFSGSQGGPFESPCPILWCRFDMEDWG